ncbi:uncharacterized protein B0P05DRAFT_536182 [Gilbertella persicaria]|uniref:uncharacterized protein n=1 Tax=Gilbertella persicaria TaxID=101096 RepID=UPI0022208AF5|nr:uncharacterized protein B0P05DRAFT_536182 [Gilbertella persicaria]KAI8084106.1 hypothetical protein B0P05DRAFT_536182 [Gilbertella persicaria]
MTIIAANNTLNQSKEMQFMDIESVHLSYDDHEEENISSSSNSSIYSDTCACKQNKILTGAADCASCHQPIPSLIHLHHDLEIQRTKALNLRSQLEEKQAQAEKHAQERQHLQATLDDDKKKLDKTMTNIESLTQDIDIVKSKHKGEIEHTIAIEQSKKCVEIELHELTQKLFEEANHLVLAEKQRKMEIQAEHDYVRSQLEQSESELMTVQAELNVLREQMKSTNETPISTHENYILRAQLDMAYLLQQQQEQPVEISELYHDPLLLNEFEQFIVTMKTTPLSKLASLPFMKQCLKSDIEPCLRFGPSPKITTKKISDAILVKSCFLESCPPGFVEKKLNQPTEKVRTSLWDRFSSSSNTTNMLQATCLYCQACGRVIYDKQNSQEEGEVTIWRFRISYFDEWALIDRYCHDRIVSVMEFYTFLRRLKVGVYKEFDMPFLYKEFYKLQLQMMLSRMGALPTILGEFGLDPNRIGMAFTELITK